MSWRTAWARIVVYGSVLALLGSGIYLVDRRDQQRAREICGLIVVLDDAYRTTTPTTELGRSIAAAVHRYRLRLGC